MVVLGGELFLMSEVPLYLNSAGLPTENSQIAGVPRLSEIAQPQVPTAGPLLEPYSRPRGGHFIKGEVPL